MIKNIISSCFALLALSAPALALSDAAVPVKIPTTWGSSAPGGNITCPIPTPSQIGITPGRASWTDGFPPLNFLPLAGGGVPPFGQDMNGAFCQLSQWTRWDNAGAPIFYDATFQSAIGGYPNNSLIHSLTNPTHFWLSLVDNNASNPDTGGANWQDLYIASAASLWGGTAGGTANVLTISITGWTQNYVGPQIQFLPSLANTSTATLSISGVGAGTIKRKTNGGLIVLQGGELQPGQIANVTWDGSAFELQSPTVVKANLVQITGSGTYTPSVGIVAADVTCSAGGGAGGGTAATGSAQINAGGGGGGGGIGEGIFSAAQLLPSVSVTIGAAGVPSTGNPGGNGGNTSFGSLLVLNGGHGGTATGLVGANSVQATGTAGSGNATTAPIALVGGLGGYGFAIATPQDNLVIGGIGGSGMFGTAGGSSQILNTGAANGTNGSNYGSGGGGAAAGATSAALIGGNGAPGACIIKELIAQ